ncbi:bidirectional sugar transporter SWEET16-like [Diospyros lotus]|uniref:bidirectional sugar transporter SWEET16-like n=1 Tax=Diospyros lotus TaxID=55363 RepID=UPI002250793D|nr:bidirectional sugar transporter SWEET16-like [Diospyros lotus]
MVKADVIVGIFGNILSILTFLAPIGTFRKIVKNKSAENYDGFPYITTLLSTSFWTFYGLLDPDDGILIVTVNSVGVVSQIFYNTIYLLYAPRNKRVKSLRLLAILNVLVLGTVIAVTLLAFHGDARRTFIGVLCATVTIGMYAAPLKGMGTAIRTKSVEYVPFFLSFFLFLNAGAWFTFAMLLKDFYVLVPNAVGIVLGAAQLGIYMVYRKRSPAAMEMDEEGGVKRSDPVENDDDEAHGKNKLGASIRSPSLSRQHSLKETMKGNEELDVENGGGEPGYDEDTCCWLGLGKNHNFGRYDCFRRISDFERKVYGRRCNFENRFERLE